MRKMISHTPANAMQMLMNKVGSFLANRGKRNSYSKEKITAVNLGVSVGFLKKHLTLELPLGYSPSKRYW